MVDSKELPIPDTPLSSRGRSASMSLRCICT